MPRFAYQFAIITLIVFIIPLLAPNSCPPSSSSDYMQPGPYKVEMTSGSYQVDAECTLAYDLYTPRRAPNGPLIVLAHGFTRSKENMAGWAEHFASWGLMTVAPSLCHSTARDADHYQNGLDMIVLAHSLAEGSFIYAGHSAGGLASLVAAANDPDAVAQFGFDAVDAGDIGLKLVPDFPAIPAYGLFAESSECNAANNTLPIYLAIPAGRAVRVTEADHCDFESPLDKKCSWVCPGTNATFSNAAIQNTIRGLSTAFMLWHAGLDPRGEEWWTPGAAPYDTLIQTGAISEITELP